MADVEVDRKTGKVSVKKFYVAHDCGQIINPDGLKNQIEGNVVQGLSRTTARIFVIDRELNVLARAGSLKRPSLPDMQTPDSAVARVWTATCFWLKSPERVWL